MDDLLRKTTRSLPDPCSKMDLTKITFRQLTHMPDLFILRKIQSMPIEVYRVEHLFAILENIAKKLKFCAIKKSKMKMIE